MFKQLERDTEKSMAAAEESRQKEAEIQKQYVKQMGFEMPKFTIVNDVQIKDDIDDAKVQILAAQEEIESKKHEEYKFRNQSLLESEMKA